MVIGFVILLEKSVAGAYYPRPAVMEIHPISDESDIIRRNESIIFELDAKTDNEGLLKLIEEGFAEYIFHIECPSTSYRNIITSSNGSKTVVINESLLNNKVNVCFFIVASFCVLLHVLVFILLRY